MPKVILDEFTRLDLTRQRRWQLRKLRDGCCQQCGKPALKDMTQCNDCEAEKVGRFTPKHGRYEGH